MQCFFSKGNTLCQFISINPHDTPIVGQIRFLRGLNHHHRYIPSCRAMAQDQLECKLKPSGSSPAALGRCPETPKRNLSTIPAGSRGVPLLLEVETQFVKHGDMENQRLYTAPSEVCWICWQHDVFLRLEGFTPKIAAIQMRKIVGNHGFGGFQTLRQPHPSHKHPAGGSTNG